MHTPRPFGRFVDDERLSDEDAAAVARLAKRLTNYKLAAALDNLRWRRVLPSGRVAMVKDMGGIFKVMVLEGEDARGRQDGKTASALEVPMLFSGEALEGNPLVGEGVKLQLTAGTTRRLANYAGAVAARQVLKRFVIEYGPKHREFVPDPDPGTRTWTQYHQLRPSWFTGAMATVAQITSGYGRQDFSNLPAGSPVEQARYRLPRKVREKMAKELGDVRLPGYTGLAPTSGELPFNYKSSETHGVCFGAGGAPWLVQITKRGVYAMPLPLVPATTTAAFREYIEAKGDAEIKWILDKFGGMPSGEGFPPTEKGFEAMRRAGVISKVCDVALFYQGIPYSLAMGWAFNQKGSEVVNTCYTYDESNGVQIGLAYKLSIRLGRLDGHGFLPKPSPLGNPMDAASVQRYLAMLRKAMQGGDRYRNDAIEIKLRRADSAEVLARAKLTSDYGAAREVDYWDNLEMKPIAAHSGNLREIGRGNLWAPGKPQWHPQIKFPVTAGSLKGCLSHDFSPADGFGRPTGIRCDTIMYAYFVGNSMMVAKYFWDERTFQRSAEFDDEECQQVGAWDATLTETATGLLGNFYTSEFDEREAQADTTTRINIVGTDLGYDTVPFFAYDHWFWRPGTLWRNRYYKHRTKSERTDGYSRAVAVCIPYLSRSALLHARIDTANSKTIKESTSLHSERDPTSYRYWTHDFVWAWNGGVSGPQASVPVYPKDGNPVWVVQENYSPGLCSDFADQGPWIPGLPADYTWLIHPDKNRWDSNGGGGEPKVNEQSTAKTSPAKPDGRIDFSGGRLPMKVGDQPASTYFLYSPDEYVGVFYRDAIKNEAGSADYVSVSEQHSGNPRWRAYQGHTRMADHQRAHHFIGVINE